MTKTGGRLAATCAMLLLTGCIAVGKIDRRAGTFDEQVADVSNNALLLNLARASHQEPVYFLALNQLSATGVTDFRAAPPQFYLGPNLPAIDKIATFGTGMGSASITESIAVDNNTGAPFNLNLFEYSNFNLLQSDNNTATVYADTVTGPGYNYASQTSGATAIQQGISSPDATYAEAGPSGTVLSDVTSGSNLNGPLTSGPGDVAWAFQWNTTVAAQPDEFDELGNGSLSITNVPEPSTFALIGLGLGALGWMRRRPLA